VCVAQPTIVLVCNSHNARQLVAPNWLFLMPKVLWGGAAESQNEEPIVALDFLTNHTLHSVVPCFKKPESDRDK